MVSFRSKLAFVMVGAGMCIAASPAYANPAASTTTAAAGAIDVSKVAADIEEGDDAQFQQLFARWGTMDKPVSSIVRAPVVSVPSRMPLDSARFSSEYGMRTHPVLGGRRNHKGIDLAAPVGTPIYATADGYVSKAEPFSSYGNYVSIEHGAEMQTRYAHMSRIAVAAGQRVKKGELIGYVGTTGRSTGPHLHYEVRIAGEAVNPMPYMTETPVQHTLAMGSGASGGQ